MSRSRTWNLRLNLDEFNALVASVFTDSDRALLLQGIALGMNGGRSPEGVPNSFERGYQFGHESRQEAEGFRAKMSENGSRGGRPAHRMDPGEVEPTGEPVGKPEGEPVGKPVGSTLVHQTRTQSTIHNPTNEQPATPPYPPEGDGREVETGETERAVVAAWNAIAPRQGFPDAGPWTDRRRKALRALTPGVGFVEEWTKAVKAMAADQWAKDKALPIDYLLRPENFDRWRSMASRSPKEEPRTPIPASVRPSSDPAEKARREANRAALLQFSATKAPRSPDLHQ